MGYYTGDPGFFSFLGKAAKTIGGAAAGFIPGIGGGLSKVISKIPVGGAVKGTAMKVGSAIIKHPVLSAAGAAAGIGSAAELVHLGRGGGARGGGMHLNKHGKLVRNRHMRVTNPKALRRSLRRVHGFAKLAMKTIHLVHPRKKVRFGGFRQARKR
jgi:hypothetical protein